MSAGPNRPFVSWETPDYEASHNGQQRDLYEIQRLAEVEAARYIIQRKNEASEDEYEEIMGLPVAEAPQHGGDVSLTMSVSERPAAAASPGASPPSDKMPLALMVELALQEALSIANIYERRGLRLNERHRKLLEELGKLADA